MTIALDRTHKFTIDLLLADLGSIHIQRCGLTQDWQLLEEYTGCSCREGPCGTGCNQERNRFDDRQNN